MKVQDEEIWRLQAMTEGIEKIREFIGHIGEVVTKAHLFDNEVKTKDHLSAQKIINVLVKYGHKMEATLGEMQKLLPKSFVVGTSQPLAQAAVPPSPKGKAQQLLDDLRGRLQECKVQEVVAIAVKIVVPILEDSPAAVLGVIPKGKNKEKEGIAIVQAWSGERGARISYFNI